MTSFTAIAKDSRIRLLVFFLCLASIIWFVGPHLIFGEVRPLLSTNQRLTALLMLSAFWGIGHWYASTLHHLNLAAQQNTLFSNEFKRWQYYFKAATNATNQGWLHNFVGKPQKNWFLVIGPQGVGKSNLLKTAHKELLDEEQLTAKPITNTKSCDFWFYPNAVIMEMFSAYFDEDNNLPLELFANEIIKSIKSSGINFKGIFLTIDALSIFREDKEPIREVNKLHTLLEQLLIHFPNIPIQIFVLKSDQISGFVEFFDDMGPEERIQSCGLCFSDNKEHKSLPEMYDSEFEAFLNRINDRLIWRLHQEHDQESRNLIKDFPIQLAMLKAQLAHLMNALIPHTDINLQGIYFTSCEQKPASVNSILPVLGRSFNLPVKKATDHPHSNKIFFIKMLMQRLLDNNLRVDEAIYGRRPKYLAVSAAVILSTIFGGGYYYFHQNNLHIQNAKLLLSKIDLQQQNHSLNTLLDKLSTLEMATKELVVKDEGVKSLSKTNKRLANKTAHTFIHLLEAEFFPILIDTSSKVIAHYSQTNDKTHLTELYDALKIYLMLTQPQYLNKEQVITWFEKTWKPHFNKEQLESLEKYTYLLFSQPLPYYQPNAILIKNARQLLTDLTEEKLIIAMINNETLSRNIQIINNPNPIILSAENNHIPAKYTAEHFHTIFHKLIPEAATKIAQGNWVLGKNALAPKSKEDSEKLIAQTRKQYLTEYREAWEHIVKNIKLPEIHRLDNFLSAMNVINGEDSPLIQLFGSIKANTTNLVTEPLFNQYVSKHFEKINNQNLYNDSSSTVKALKRLTTYMNTVAGAKSREKAAFSAAKARMTSPSSNDPIDHLILVSRQTPEPIKTWFSHLATASWQLILEAAKNHVQEAWVTLLLPEYKMHIDNRYPVFSKSSNEMSLKEFSTFFQPRGLMDLFFNAYVEPFVDMKNYAYTWKVVNGQHINLDQSVLDIFIRVALIQKMFFVGADNRLGVNFSLIPVGLNPNISDFSININGQKVEYQPQSSGSPLINWPGATSDGVLMKFTNTASKATELKYKGEWGWFKLLSQSHLQATNNAKDLSISFNYAGAKVADFTLSTTNVINPFTPNILNTFRCPDKLG